MAARFLIDAVRCGILTALALGCGAHAFNLEVASARSAGLTQAQMNQAWGLFESATPLVTAGRHADALVKLRQGLAIHPAEAGIHLLAAHLADAADQPAQAATHWQAVLSFAAPGSEEQQRAERALRRILPQLPGAGADLATCSVLGLPMQARQSQCDTPTPGTAAGIFGGEDIFKGLRLQLAVGPKARVKDEKMEFKACVDARGMPLSSWHALLNHSGTGDGPFAQEQVRAWLYPVAAPLGSDQAVALRHLQAAREGRCNVILDTPQRLQQIAGQLPAGWKLSSRTFVWGELFANVLKRANFTGNEQRMALVALGGDFATGWYYLGRAGVHTKAQFDAMAQEILAKGFSRETSSRVMDVYGRVKSGEIAFNEGKREVRYFGSPQEADQITQHVVRLFMAPQLR